MTTQHLCILLHPVPQEPKKTCTSWRLSSLVTLGDGCMLVLMCFLSFGSYYVYDNLAALQKTIMNVSSVTAPERIGLSVDLPFSHKFFQLCVA